VLWKEDIKFDVSRIAKEALDKLWSAQGIFLIYFCFPVLKIQFAYVLIPPRLYYICFFFLRKFSLTVSIPLFCVNASEIR
jgi:hypothetical protein